ncbi:MbcA/ParS/Xre antitoxin family protein [Luteithermobacter gelatinilyticus]|uniref:MbcA/ParS/Xre antitoxin family protein n=1 Tax=Luteithermobacter gelatinilyticus TaxID=2582913 RepID=UPI00110662A8|nr:MbcA/ParS/Xre antitoxin family protein [Luteithermobacter gelatinilyticus]
MPTVGVHSRSDRTEPDKDRVLSMAVARAAGFLAISNKELAGILGLSQASVSRLMKGQYLLREGRKEYELGVLLVRLFRSLDALTGGDDRSSRSWLRSENLVLGGRPVDLITTITGLMGVIAYVDSRRAKL